MSQSRTECTERVITKAVILSRSSPVDRLKGLRGTTALVSCIVLLAAVSCSEKAVEVEGAVQNRGLYPYVEGWTVQDYIRGAGGLTSEADTSDQYLIRMTTDSVQNILTHRKLLTLVDTLLVQEGDLIRIPFRTYLMEFETTRSVRDLVIESNGRRYVIPRGIYASGNIEQGPVAGIVIGEGKVTNLKNSEAVSPFHYVYLRGHPDLIGELSRQFGEEKTSLETLEDAVEIHRLHYVRAGFQTEYAVRLPDPGTLVVVAGIWLNPKSGSSPGRGMRRRRYEDGRTWTTYPDGRQRWIYPDGRVVVTYPAGKKEIREPDGRLVTEYESGFRQVAYPSGMTESIYSNGSRQIVYEDGTVRHFHTSGTVVTLLPNGDRKARFPDGTLQVEYANGVVETTYPDGRKDRQLLNGWTEVRMPDGRIANIDPDGLQIVKTPTGTQIYMLASGVKIQREPDGRVMTIFPDGTKQISDVLGNITTTMPNGEVLGRPEAMGWFFSDQGWDLDKLDTGSRAGYLDMEDKRVIVELNKARSNPARYAEETVKPLFDYYEDNLLKLPGIVPVHSKEGVLAARELYDYLKLLRPRRVLWPSEGMCRAATDHVRDQFDTRKVGHIGSDGSLPQERINRYGVARVTSEAIAYGNRSGGLIVLQLLVDDGVQNRGHRKALLDARFRKIGVSIGPNPVFGRACDILLADDFRTKH